MGTSNVTPSSVGCSAPGNVNRTSRNSNPSRNPDIATASGRSATSLCVSRTSKMRSVAAIACCKLAFTRLSFLAGPYIRKSAAMNATKSPEVRRPAVISWLPYHSAATNATPPISSMSGGSTLSALVTFMLVL